MKKPQKTKQEFDTKAALKPKPFSLAQYIHLCLIDYTFSSLGKRDLRHANSSLGTSCATSHSLMSNPIDLYGPTHVSKRSSPPPRVAQSVGFQCTSLSAPPSQTAPCPPCFSTSVSSSFSDRYKATPKHRGNVSCARNWFDQFSQDIHDTFFF